MDQVDEPQHPKRAAVAALARRFDLADAEWMQDWEYEVADARRIDDFLSYAESRPHDDEAFVLMMIIFQSFEDLGHQALTDTRWGRVERLLHQDIALHQPTLDYWAAAGEAAEHLWTITPLVRSVIATQAAD